MRVLALKSFTGKISMAENEIREISEKEIFDDLIKAEYVVEIKVEPEKSRRKNK